MAARPPFGAGNKETNPCSLCVPSRCGLTGLLHVLPLSREKAILTLYAYVPGPLFASQCAARLPSGSAIIDGKSAQFTNQLSPCAIACGGGHWLLAPSTENFKWLVCAAVSIQLKNTRPSDATLRFGSPLPWAAGDAISVNDAADCCPPVGTEARTNKPIAVTNT